MNCQRKGCLSQATSAIAINVPATGLSLEEHRPIRLVIGLSLCDRCFGEINASELLEADPRFKSLIERIIVGHPPPDFERAFLSRVEFDDPAYVRLKAKNG